MSALPFLALPVVEVGVKSSENLGRNFDRVFEKRVKTDKTWMLIERQHGKSGIWHSMSLHPLAVNRVWNRLPNAFISSRSKLSPSFVLYVANYHQFLKNPLLTL